ncbi:uncharacterized protein SPSK_02016 [Sporothrix schenckii 1099-18]|uniref:Uncharacterized protein n=1 Tax=Sporothrix schenckii 1099-18 TaxID=1397361 RepID=A0A0F2MBX4_SPOSC|nr:uncharacterized protein SPSK_02016 [Sporothrix schenckii 1099-18]KJR87137.1 hypothetical protein SPSK_02016 [Sporothrix schenckii 1099-18]
MRLIWDAIVGCLTGQGWFGDWLLPEFGFAPRPKHAVWEGCMGSRSTNSGLQASQSQKGNRARSTAQSVARDVRVDIVFFVVFVFYLCSVILHIHV